MEKHAHVFMTSGHFHAFYQPLQNGKTKCNFQHKLRGQKGKKDKATRCESLKGQFTQITSYFPAMQ